MAKIAHFEVYVDAGDGWRLLNRFAFEERSQAFNVAKESEKQKLGVKVIKETFSTDDGTYLETVEYVKNLKSPKKSIANNPGLSIPSFANQKILKERLNAPKVVQALVILLSIIVISIVIANVFATLALPLLEMLFPEDVTRSIFFIGLFAMFILIALPLMLNRVPWQDLSITSFDKNKIDDDMFYHKAETIVARYNLNEDFADDKTPVFPEAGVAYKKQIVTFLAQVLAILSNVKLDNFNKLGLKLVIYGATLEFAQYNRLVITQVNSLLQEAFNVIDGDSIDLVDFYEAKRSYRDNKMAIFLTGVGAYLMDRFLLSQPIDREHLISGFTRWENMNTISEDVGGGAESKVELKIANLVSIKYNVKLFDTSLDSEENMTETQISNIKKIVNQLSSKFEAQKIVEDNNISTMSFGNLILGIAFAKQLLGEIKTYVYELNNENIIFNIRINLIKDQTNNDNTLYILDVFEYTNDDEILTTFNIVEEAKGETNLAFQSIGKKLLTQTSKMVELFKIV